MAQKPDDIIYGVDEKPPWHRLSLLTIQHTVVMLVYLIMIVIVGKKAGARQEEMSTLLSLAAIALAIGSLLQALPKGPVGSGFLAVPVISAIYLSPSLLAAEMGGMPLVFGMTLVAGAVEMVFSFVFQRLRWLFPPAVCGLAVILVGLELGLVGFEAVLDVKGDVARAPAVITGVVALVVMIGASIWARGVLRLLCSLLGIIVGALVAIPFGLTRAHSVDIASWIDYPRLGVISYDFSAYLVVPFLVAGVVASLRTMGVITTCQRINDSSWRRPHVRSIQKGTLADGLGALIGGMIGSMGISAAPSLVGISKASGATSRLIAFLVAALLIVLAFVPKVLAIILLLPLSIIGAALIFNSSFMIVGGLQIAFSRNVRTRETFVLGITILLATSYCVYQRYFGDMPSGWRWLTGNALVIGMIAALVMTLIFRIGLKRRASTHIKDQGDQEAFVERQLGEWEVAGEDQERIRGALHELVYQVNEASVAKGPLLLDMASDGSDLTVSLRYTGELLTVPHFGGDKAVYVEEEAFSAGLASYLSGIYPDRFSSGAKGDAVHIEMVFHL